MKKIIAATLALLIASTTLAFADEEIPAPRMPVSDIIAIVLIAIGVIAIIASIIILRKKRARR